MTHAHHCPFCEESFDCEVPFCDGLPNLMCDSCWEADAKIIPHPDGYQQVVDYAREREAVESEDADAFPMPAAAEDRHCVDRRV